MSFICIACVKDLSLKKFISTYGVDNILCDVCHEKRRGIDTNNNHFHQLFKALIRFHYHEYEYNTHWGGNSLESFFYSENPILECRNDKDEDGLCAVLEDLIHNVYEDYDKGVTLYAGYFEGMPTGILRSIKSEIHPILEKITELLKTENYFNLESEMHSLLIKYKGVIDIQVPVNTEFVRARIGFKDKKSPSNFFIEPQYHYVPYSGSEISAPLPSLAKAGRINRAGVSFFYAATDLDTAISETRPHPGDIMSIGWFKTKQTLLLADFTETYIEYFSDTDQLLDDFLTIHSINVYLNKVVPPIERGHYSVTQLIADTLRQHGYDGIKYISTVGKGHNIVVFHPEHLVYKNGDGQVFEIQGLKYTISEKIVVSNQNDYL